MAMWGLSTEAVFKSALSVMRMKCQGCSLWADGALMAACISLVRSSGGMGCAVNERMERRVRMVEIKSLD